MKSAITPLGGGDPEPWVLQQISRSQGIDEGIARGREIGLNEGYQQGYNVGYAEGNTAGYNEAIDEGNVAIAGLQANHKVYQEQVGAQFQELEEDRNRLRLAVIEQAKRIRELEEKLVQRDQVVGQLHAQNEAFREANQELAEENAALQEDNAALKQLVQTLRQANENLQENIEDLAKSNREKSVKLRDQINQYNKTVVFINAIKGVVESVIAQDPAMENQIKSVFAGEYKKAVDFKMSVDEITGAPHEDRDFALMLPQTHKFIVDMLSLNEPTFNQEASGTGDLSESEDSEFAL